jgi:hypothetical protein
MKCTDKTHNSINHCGHRELAMTLIEKVVEPQLGKGLDGDVYYEWEDDLTYCLAKNMKSCNGTQAKMEKAWKKER